MRVAEGQRATRGLAAQSEGTVWVGGSGQSASGSPPPGGAADWAAIPDAALASALDDSLLQVRSRALSGTSKQPRPGGPLLVRWPAESLALAILSLHITRCRNETRPARELAPVPFPSPMAQSLARCPDPGSFPFKAIWSSHLFLPSSSVQQRRPHEAALIALQSFIYHCVSCIANLLDTSSRSFSTTIQSIFVLPTEQPLILSLLLGPAPLISPRLNLQHTADQTRTAEPAKSSTGPEPTSDVYCLLCARPTPSTLSSTTTSPGSDGQSPRRSCEYQGDWNMLAPT